MPFCSDLRDRVNCRMPQSVGNGGVTFRWEEVMQTVPRILIQLCTL